MQAVTIKDVARETGYSLMTVSNAFTGRGRIGDETRRDILDTASRLGYVPNLAARALRGSQVSQVKAPKGFENGDPRPLRSGIIALVLDRQTRLYTLEPWVRHIQSIGGVGAVYFSDEPSFSLERVAAARPDGVVWFGPFESAPPVKWKPGIKVVAARGGPRRALTRLMHYK